MKKRFWFSVVMATVGTGLLLAAGFASPAESGPQATAKANAAGGTLRISFSPADFDYIDTTLAYFSH